MTTTLRDGTVTSDQRLDRLIEFDEKSRSFPVPDPRPAVSRVHWLPRSWALDQGREGACVGAAITHEVKARPVAAGWPTMQWARERIYYPAQRDYDRFPGGEYPGAQPAMAGTSILAGAKAAVAAGVWGGFRWAFNIDQGVSAVTHDGPGVLGLAITEGMIHPRPGGLVRDEGEVVGGHAMCWLGVRYGVRFPGEPRLFDVAVLPQSWGRDHGDDGRIYLPLTDLQARLADDGEQCFPVARRYPPR